MALVTPRPACPGYGSLGLSRLALGAVGFLTAADLGVTLPQTLTAGVLFTMPNTILVAGYNSFMVIYSTVGGTTITFRAGVLDPVLETSILDRTIVGALAPALNTQATYGAFGQTLVASQGDVWWLTDLRFLANTTNSSLTALLFWCGSR